MVLITTLPVQPLLLLVPLLLLLLLQWVLIPLLCYYFYCHKQAVAAMTKKTPKLSLWV